MNFKFPIDEKSTDLQLNFKAQKLADQYDLPEQDKIKLEVDVVSLAWEYYKTKNERCE